MYLIMMAVTTIRIEKSTREALRLCGFKGQTYNEIILNLINKKGPTQRPQIEMNEDEKGDFDD